MRVTVGIVSTVCVAALGGLLSACTPRLTPTPALVVPGPDGWPSVQVALCGEEKIHIADLYRGEGEIEHRESPSTEDSDRVVTFVFSPETIEAGSLTDQVPVTQFIPFPQVPSSPNGLGSFFIHTTEHNVSIDFSSVWQDPPSPVLVFGTTNKDAEAYVKIVTLDEGEATINGWCASID